MYIKRDPFKTTQNRCCLSNTSGLADCYGVGDHVHVHVTQVTVPLSQINDNGHYWDQQICPLMEVSSVEGSFNIIKNQNGTRQVSLVVRCPLFRGVLYKGVHCSSQGRLLFKSLIVF